MDPQAWPSSLREREKGRVIRGSKDTRPGFSVAGSAELTPSWRHVEGSRGVKGESWSSATTFHVLTLPTSERGPTSVLPLTNQICTSSFLGEHGGVLQGHQRWVCYGVKGRHSPPPKK